MEQKKHQGGETEVEDWEELEDHRHCKCVGWEAEGESRGKEQGR